ncbi:hypothetical protein CDL15_Pgr005181 [Punica granatum]|uniref:Eukaryotic translation initiation factor 5A n=1 Tax=Punica granatum TaxID=22663 RepID=A0A218WQW3_PUNGR|nr:hypothetical protein CDL15_Pgr005181 [Punica granatum]
MQIHNLTREKVSPHQLMLQKLQEFEIFLPCGARLKLTFCQVLMAPLVLRTGTIRKNGYIVIKNRPSKLVEVSTSKTGKHDHGKCHFVRIDIFNAKKLEDIVPSSHNCDIPHVTRTDYQLIDISEDGFESLLIENGKNKDDLRLPTDENLLS